MLLVRYCTAWADWVELDGLLQQGGKIVRGPKGTLVRSPAWLMRRGSQYTSAEFGRLLGAHGVVQSLSCPRQCWDNAVAESFFATLKIELVYRSAWPTRGAVRRAVFEFIEVFYNRRRLHSALGYCSPAEYEAAMPSRASSTSAA